MERSAIRGDFTADKTRISLRSIRLRRDVLLPVIRQHLVAAFGEPATVLLEAGEHSLIAIVHHRAAEARDVARTGIVTGLLR